MAGLTRQEMEEILRSRDFEARFSGGAIAQNSLDPHSKFTRCGAAIVGEDSIEPTYTHLIKSSNNDRNIETVTRLICQGENTLIREAIVSFDRTDGSRVKGQYLLILKFDPELRQVIDERM